MEKQIPFDTMLSRAYWRWRENLALSVPTMFSTGLSSLGESIFGLFVIGLIVRLEGTSALTALVQDYSSGDYGAAGRIMLSGSFIDPVLEYLVPAAVVTLVVLVLASGFVYSAEYGSYIQAIGGSKVAISDVMSRFVERWRPMAWTLFVSYLITLAPVGAGLALLGVAIATGAGATALLGALVATLAGGVASLILSFLFIYTPVVVSAEKVTGVMAVRRSASQAMRNKEAAFAYGIVFVVLSAAITEVASVVPVANLPLSSLASVGILLLVTPVLHLTKTEVYVELQKPEQVGYELHKSMFSDLFGPMVRALWRKFVTGLHELRAYATSPENFVYHAVSALALIGGIFLGVRLGGGLTQVVYALGYVPGRINPLVTGSAPGTVGVYIFFHNWEAALSTALSGVWFGGAPFVTLMLNGVLVGVVSDLVPNTTMLAAALLPHGIIELPSFVLAGSAGLKLGVSFYRSLRSGDPGATAEFHRVARQTVYVVIGLALLFFIAGFIEGNITPVIMKYAGWAS